MSAAERWFPSHLREMTRAECLELLASHRVGRVAYCDDLGPVVLPVNYAVDGHVLVLRIGEGTKRDALQHANVAFEVDQVEQIADHPAPFRAAPAPPPEVACPPCARSRRPASRWCPTDR